MDNSKYAIDQMISAKSIAARVEALAEEITKFYKGTDKLVVVGLLRGSFVFIADLAREIDLPVEIDFLEASSYGNQMESSREVRILKDLNDEISGKAVLDVEDIVDTGETLSKIRSKIINKANSVAIAAFLLKPKKAKVNFEIDWVGFEIPDEFVVGYGLDYNQKFRNLKGIYQGIEI